MPRKKTERPRARKKAVRRPAKKKVVRKKVAMKPARKVTRKAAPRKAAPKPKEVTPAPPRPLVEKRPPAPPIGVAEQRVGVVTHYYTNLGVAVVKLEQGSLQLGDTIHIKGHTSDFRQVVESMEIEHQKIERAVAGQEFGLKVVEHAREHDEVYKVIG